jgi:hypothetical protein
VAFLDSIASFFITTVSVAIALIAYLYEKKKSEKIKSCELEKYYIDYIIPKIDYVSSIFNSSKLSELLRETFKHHEIVDFDYSEMTRLLGSVHTEDEIIDKLNSIDPKQLLRCKLFFAKDNIERNAIRNNYLVKKAKDEAAPAIDSKSLINELMKLITKLMNELEWFSMHFTYKIADEKLVYQSLHQTFTSNVQLLYFFISRANKSPSEKYYTNIIQLYTSWYSFKVKQQKRQRKLQNILIRRGNPL